MRVDDTSHGDLVEDEAYIQRLMFVPWRTALEGTVAVGCRSCSHSTLYPFGYRVVGPALVERSRRVVEWRYFDMLNRDSVNGWWLSSGGS